MVVVLVVVEVVVKGRICCFGVNAMRDGENTQTLKKHIFITTYRVCRFMNFIKYTIYFLSGLGVEGSGKTIGCGGNCSGVEATLEFL